MQTSWQWTPAQNVSNEDTDIRTFQRTRSAQLILEQGQTLLQQTATTTTASNNDPRTSESMESNDDQSQPPSQSTFVGTE